MRYRSLVFCAICLSAFLSWGICKAGDEKVPLQLRAPIGLDEMKAYEEGSFTKERFDTIKRGMTEEEVLGILGKPLDLKREHRPSNKWTVHYFYPGGCEVNFKNGLVVGKECS